MAVPFSQVLYAKIKAWGFMSLDDIHKLCNEYGRKQSTAERVLRASVAPSYVVTVYNKKDQVIGYKYKNTIV